MLALGRQSALAWIGAALVVLALGCRIASVRIAVFDWDEYAFALVARDVLHGKLPLSGVFDNKPAGLSYVFALAEWIGGQRVAALRGVGFAAAAITSALLLRSARRLALAPAASLAVAAMFLFLVLDFDGWASMSELVACPLLAIVNDLAVRERWRTRWPLVASGAAFGVAGQISYLTLPCFALMAPAIVQRQPADRRPVASLLLAAGFAAATGLIWTPQILSGDWPAYIGQQIAYHRQYRIATPAAGHWLAAFARPMALLLAPAAAALGLRAWARRGAAALPVAFWLIGLEAAGAAAAAAASNRFFPHYFILVVPAACWLTAIALAGAVPRAQRIGTAALLLAVTVLAAGTVTALHARLRWPAFETAAAALVDQHSAADAGIFVFDETPALYFLARRAAVSRYVFPGHYIAHDGATALVGTAAALAEALAQHPALLVVGHLFPVPVDAGAAASAAGYRPIGTLAAGARRIELWGRLSRPSG